MPVGSTKILLWCLDSNSVLAFFMTIRASFVYDHALVIVCTHWSKHITTFIYSLSIHLGYVCSPAFMWENFRIK